MARKKYRVRVHTAFTHTIEPGALMVGDRQIATSQTQTFHYVEGQRIEFSTKKDAVAFWKAHRDHAMYLGPET